MESRRGRRACPKGLRREKTQELGRASGADCHGRPAWPALPTGAVAPPPGKKLTVAWFYVLTCLTHRFSQRASLSGLLCIFTLSVCPVPLAAATT